MKKSIEEQLVNRMKLSEALKSGQYSKGIEQLRDREDNYCVLGVACDVMRTSYPNFNWALNTKDKNAFYCFIDTEDPNTRSCLPEVLHYIYPYYGFSYEQVSHMIDLNDNTDISFPLLAEKCIDRL